MFVEAYIGEANGNGAEAARIAGYGAPKEAASRLLTYVNIRSAVERRVSCAAMSANEVLARIAEIATSDLGEFLSIGKESCHVQIKRGQRTRLIKKLKRTKTTKDEIETETTDIEVRDPFPALVKLGEYHGLWNRDQSPPLELKEFARKLKERLAKKNAGKP